MGLLSDATVGPDLGRGAQRDIGRRGRQVSEGVEQNLPLALEASPVPASRVDGAPGDRTIDDQRALIGQMSQNGAILVIESHESTVSLSSN
ncbi:hypothetical protein GCM10010983_07480 [Caulobacter rhizosphaerae]|nr:hypothetical protein GCM10010983_07480 [Caulobacter rhizosphaerae]